MASVPLRNPFTVNVDAFAPLPPPDPEQRALLFKLLNGELDGEDAFRARLIVMQWLAHGSAVALNCIFTLDGKIDIRARCFIIDGCVNARLLANEDAVEAARDATFDDPLPSENESPVVKRVADWFRRLVEKDK